MYACTHTRTLTHIYEAFIFFELHYSKLSYWVPSDSWVGRNILPYIFVFPSQCVWLGTFIICI